MTGEFPNEKSNPGWTHNFPG